MVILLGINIWINRSSCMFFFTLPNHKLFWCVSFPQTCGKLSYKCIRVGEFLTLVVKTSDFLRLKPSCQKQVFDQSKLKTSKIHHEHLFKINMVVHLMKICCYTYILNISLSAIDLVDGCTIECDMNYNVSDHSALATHIKIELEMDCGLKYKHNKLQVFSKVD